MEGNRVKLSVEVEESEFDRAVDAALRKIARDVRIPGFRPGKAPRRLLEARMGKAGLRQEAMREALPEYYAEALRQTELDAIAPPEIDITSGEGEGPLAFDAVVEVRPELEIVGYQGLRVTVPSPAVTDEEVSRQIDRLRQPFGELGQVDRPVGAGDHVTVNSTVTRGDDVLHQADDELYEAGSGAMGDDLDTHLIGSKPGDVLAFDTTLGEGEAVSFKVLVKDVKEMVLPEVTDEWAAEASEFETVAELEADLRARMGMVKKVQTNMAVRQETVRALAELVQDEVPQPLVNAEMERRLHDLAHRLESQGATIEQYLEATGQGQHQLVEDLRGAATEAVKADLALRAVADAEQLEATEDDISTEMQGLAERMSRPADQLRVELERADQMPAVRSDIRKAKALGWLMEHVEIVDEEGNPIDPADLAPDPVDDAGTDVTGTDDDTLEDTE